MSNPVPPLVECDEVRALLPVADLAAAVDFYTKKLGFKLAFTWGGDPPTFAGVNLGKVQMYLRKGTPNPQGSSISFLVGDADRLYEFHRANGVEIAEEIDDRDYGIRDYGVHDLYGYSLFFGHYLPETGPHIKIERVNVPVRLEKRLASLLHDLAARKKMTVNSCLEEILLHTNDGVEPHTRATLRYIEELKKKHGIDYDTHASYRFVEE